MKKLINKNITIKNSKGITLVTLVITIILLLILVGITISSLIGNGLFEKAELAKENVEEASNKENVVLDEYDGVINGYINGTRDTVTSDDDKIGSMTKFELKSLIANEVSLQLSNNLSSSTKKYYEKTFSNVNVVKEVNTSLSTITLPAGIYVIVGFANYEGNDLRWHLTLGNATAVSAYDNSRICENEHY